MTLEELQTAYGELLERVEQLESQLKSSKTGKKATRLPEPFFLTGEMKAWAQGKHKTVDVVEATQQFCDYWRAVPGQRGTKLDWEGTWRNWIRTTAQRQQGKINGTAKPGSFDDWNSKHGVQGEF